MKNSIIIISAMLLLAFGATAQSMHKKVMVNDKVSQAFTQKYPQADVKSWHAVNGLDVALFTTDKRRQHAYFHHDGTWVRTETKLPESKDLPDVVRNAWGNSAYKSWKLSSIKYVTSPKGEMYTVRVGYDYGPDGSVPSDDMDEVRLYYKPDGTFIKKVDLSD